MRIIKRRQMEKEVNEYIEDQPKKKMTEEEYITWLDDLAKDSRDRHKITVEKFQKLKRDYPEIFK
jgi:hypothetical protein